MDATIEAINSQREIANEISEAISNPLGAGVEIDEVNASHLLNNKAIIIVFLYQDDLKQQLAEYEAEALSETLTGAGRVPIHSPTVPGGKVAVEREYYVLICNYPRC